MEKLKISHVVLYAKGWYHYSNDIWEDMKKCLTCDNYQGEFMTKNDIISVIVSHFEKLKPKGNNRTLLGMISGISPERSHIVGYYHIDSPYKSDRPNLHKYDIKEATLRYCLSEFKFISNDEWEAIPPDFENCLPKCPKTSYEKVKEHFYSNERV